MWKSLRHKASLARELSLSDGSLLLQAWCVLLGFFLALRLVSLQRLQASFRLRNAKKMDPALFLSFADRLQRLVSLAAHLHLLPMPCLVRACSLHWMLRRRVLPSQLCIGVNSSLNGLQAHAWVDLLGHALGEPGDIEARFKVLQPG